MDNHVSDASGRGSDHSRVPRGRVLVTGGGGYLGSVLVPLLLHRGSDVHVVDCFYFGGSGLESVEGHPRLTISCEDILHQENLPSLFHNVEAVVHLASISNDPSCDLDPNLSIRTNFLATIALARRARMDGVRRFVFMSSCSVYGAAGHGLLDETSATGPVTLYALTKLEGEHELLGLSSPDFAVTVLRLATLFGYSPRMRFDLAVNFMCKTALQGSDILVNGDGKQYRPFLHVRDAAEAITAVLEYDPSVTGGQIYNVGNEAANYHIADLASEVQLAFPHISVVHGQQGNDIRSYQVTCKKIREELGVEPARSVSFGVNELVKAYQDGLFVSMDDARYYNVVVMKDADRVQHAAPSPASAPRWAQASLEV